ncbi:restriction endonuclease subunit S [Acinetobacter gerneri]
MASPKLRFKEFDGDWCISPLKNLCKINQGLQIAIEERFLEDAENRFFYITNEFLRDGAKKSYFIENPPISVRCKSEDILMTRTGNTGQVVTNVEGAFHNNFFKIDFDRKQIDKNFFVEFLRKNTTQHLILKYAGASTIPDLNHSDFYRIQMPITSIDEQTKIASFLSAVDEKISQLTQKHELLSQYKQGMMQKLFSQQIRFKADDGSEFGEWEDKPLNEIASKRSGKNKDGSISEVLTNSATQGIIKQSDYFEREIVTESNLNGYYIVNLDDFVYNPRISVHAPVGPIKRNKKCLGVMSPLYTVFTVIQGNLKYLEYFFDSNFWHDYVKGVANSGARHDRMNITNKDFFDMPILYPCLEEQTKIANFLSAIDQKIEVVAQQIEQAKTWKKGLLQQMFV